MSQGLLPLETDKGRQKCIAWNSSAALSVYSLCFLPRSGTDVIWLSKSGCVYFFLMSVMQTS